MAQSINGSPDTADASWAACNCTCGLSGCASNIAVGAGSRGGSAHGSPRRYIDAGCRCNECVAGENARRSGRFRTSQLATESGKSRGKRWTGPEMEIATRDDLSATEAAKMLGRTYASVKMMRHRCRNDPKYSQVVGS